MLEGTARGHFVTCMLLAEFWHGIHRQDMTLLGVVQSNIVNTTNWALTDAEYAAITGIKHQLRLLDGCPWLHEVGPYRYCHLLSLCRVPPAFQHLFSFANCLRRGSCAYAYKNASMHVCVSRGPCIVSIACVCWAAYPD